MEESTIKLIKSVLDHAVKGETSASMKGDAKKARTHWETVLFYIQELEKNNRSLNDEKTLMTQANQREEHGKIEGKAQQKYTDRSQQTDDDEANESTKLRKIEGQAQQKYTDRSQQTDDDEANESTKARTHIRSSNVEGDNGARKLENESMKRQRPETPNLMKKLRKENVKLKEDVVKYQQNIAELETRLSSIAGFKLTAGNPNITDLSDPYRPTLLGEQFRGLYDNEWTDLLTCMEKLELKEPDIIDIMCDIIKNIDKFCSEAKDQQVIKLIEMVVGEVRNPEFKVQRNMTCVKYTAKNTDELNKVEEKTVERFVMDLHKALSSVSCVPLNQIFDTYFMDAFRTKHGQLKDGCPELNDFVSKAIQLLWMMKGHLPPVVLMWCQPDQPFDKAHFSFYTCKGDTVSQCIWPAVLLHKEGPLIARGIAQGK